MAVAGGWAGTVLVAPLELSIMLISCPRCTFFSSSPAWCHLPTLLRKALARDGPLYLFMVHGRRQAGGAVELGDIANGRGWVEGSGLR